MAEERKLLTKEGVRRVLARKPLRFEARVFREKAAAERAALAAAKAAELRETIDRFLKELPDLEIQDNEEPRTKIYELLKKSKDLNVNTKTATPFIMQCGTSKNEAMKQLAKTFFENKKSPVFKTTPFP